MESRRRRSFASALALTATLATLFVTQLANAAAPPSSTNRLPAATRTPEPLPANVRMLVNGSAATAVVVSPDGARAVILRPKSASLREDGGRERRLAMQTRPAFALWSPDARSFAIAVHAADAAGTFGGGTIARVAVFDMEGRPLREVAAMEIAWMPDGKRVLIARLAEDWNRLDVVIVDVATGDETVIGAARNGSTGASLAVSPDGSWVAVADEDARLRLLESKPGGRTRELLPRTDGFLHPFWGPAGRLGVVRSENWAPPRLSSVMTLDPRAEAPAARTVVPVFTRHGSSGAAFSPDGSQIAWVHETLQSLRVFVTRSSGGPGEPTLLAELPPVAFAKWTLRWDRPGRIVLEGGPFAAEIPVRP